MFSVLCYFVIPAVALSSFSATASSIDDLKQDLQKYVSVKLRRLITSSLAVCERTVVCLNVSVYCSALFPREHLDSECACVFLHDFAPVPHVCLSDLLHARYRINVS